MIEQSGVWFDLGIGRYLKDATGVTWRIIDSKAGYHRIRNRDGVEKTLKPRPPETPVTLVVPTEEEAVENLIRGLDAEVMGIIDSNICCWRVGPFRTEGQGCMLEARTHMSMFHGTYTNDVKSMKGLLEAHDAMHESVDHHFTNPHKHSGGHHACRPSA